MGFTTPGDSGRSGYADVSEKIYKKNIKNNEKYKK
jgi:hypothetical protein